MQVTHDQHRALAVAKKYPLRFMLLDIELPENVGSLFRLADALGVEHLHLCGSTLAPPNAKLRKVARNTDRHVAFSYGQNAIELVQTLKSEGWLVVSLEYCTNSTELGLFTVPENAKVCVVLGAEKYGINEAVLRESDAVVHIPMLGENSSMNVANAAAICAYELSRQLKEHIN